MLRDPVLLVRQAAITAAGHRDLGAPVATAARRILLSEPEQELRFEVLRALGEKLLRAGQRQVVESIAANDASSAVKAKANELLRQGSE